MKHNKDTPPAVKKGELTPYEKWQAQMQLKRDKDVSPYIEGDESIPYENWQEYEDAVAAGIELDKPEVKMVGRPDYAFNVDKALDCIDLTFEGYIPSAEAIDFFNVMQLVLGEKPEVKNSLMHYFLVDLIFNNISREQYPYNKEITDKIRINEKKIAIIASRMSAKSTIVTAYLPIYLAIKGHLPNFGPIVFVVGFGDSQKAGAKVQANTIRDFCEDSVFCKDYFQKMRFTDEECEFVRKGPEVIRKRSFMYKVKGAAGGSVRSIRYRTQRPAMILFDDIIKNEADAGSTVIMKKLHSMMYSDAIRALGGKGKVVTINTPFNKKDPIYSALESGIWTPVCLPICERISLDLKKEDYVGSWEDMHSYEKLMEEYEDAYYGDTLREFNQELMLRISSESDKMVKKDMIKPCSSVAMRKVIHNYTLVVTTDFTASASKKGDFSGIALWAIGVDDNKFLLDLWLKKSTIQEQYDALFSMLNRWSSYGRVIEVGVEIDGQQQTNIFALEQMMLERNFWFRFAKQKGASSAQQGIRSKAAGGNKLERFKYMTPSFEGRKVWFAEELEGTPDMIEMRDELEYLSYESIGSKHDDGIDLISQLGLIEYIIPSNTQGVEETTSRSLFGIDWTQEEDTQGNNSMIF